jgi:hypothetical protein
VLHLLTAKTLSLFEKLPKKDKYSMKNKSVFWLWWLIIVTFSVLLLGISMVLLPDPTQKLFNLLILGSIEGNPTFNEAAITYIKLVYAVLGALMFGWGMLLLYILLGSFRRGEAEGWRMMTLSVTAWFIPDTGYSLWSGFWQNAVLNLGFAIAFAIPLIATYKALNETRS